MRKTMNNESHTLRPRSCDYFFNALKPQPRMSGSRIGIVSLVVMPLQQCRKIKHVLRCCAWARGSAALKLISFCTPLKNAQVWIREWRASCVCLDFRLSARGPHAADRGHAAGRVLAAPASERYSIWNVIV